MGSLVAWLVANVLPGFLKGMFGVVDQAKQEAQTRADTLELGQQRQARVDQDTALAADRRLDAARSAPRDDATTSGSLKDGTF